MMIVGLTGGIGSGKSTVARFFGKLGVPIYIADEAAKRIQDTSEIARREIIALLGEKAYRGNKPDRKFIASKVFGNEQLLLALNQIVHPKVRADFAAWKQRQKFSYCIYEAAILFENGGESACDYTILVTAPKEMRIQRILKRDPHLEREHVELRMNAQWSDSKKIGLADFVLENKTLPITEKSVEELHLQLIGPLSTAP